MEKMHLVRFFGENAFLINKYDVRVYENVLVPRSTRM